MNDFNSMTQPYAICTYLKSFGYEAQVDNNTFQAYVKDPTEDSFIVVQIPTWEVAREFIKVRSES
jgi:hypothetical protein